MDLEQKLALEALEALAAERAGGTQSRAERAGDDHRGELGQEVIVRA